jgi:hypothetical protein
MFLLDSGAYMPDIQMDEGIYVISSDKAGISGCYLDLVPAFFFVRGDSSLLERPRAAILNSRKSRRVSPWDRWLEVTEWCVGQAVDQGYVVVSSLGAITYNWVTFLAKNLGSPLVMVCDDVLPWMQNEKRKNTFLEMYGDLFEPGNTLFLSPFDSEGLQAAKERGPIRDACVAALSHKLWVAEIRPDGNMERLIKRAVGKSMSAAELVIANGEATTSPVRRAALRRGAEENHAAHALSEGDPLREEPSNSVNQDRYLTHFTRTCPGPWPGQSLNDYLESLWLRHENAVHSAFDTLVRILTEQRIRGSSRLVRGPEPEYPLRPVLLRK